MRALAAQLRGGLRLGATGRPIRDVVHIGIGGSDLGPRLVCSALDRPARLAPRGRRRGVRLQRRSGALDARARPASIRRRRCSSSPPRPSRPTETLRNATSAREWLAAQARRRRRARRALHRGHRECRGGARVRRRRRRRAAAVGLGRRALLALVGGRARHRHALRLGRASPSCSPARRRWTRTSATRRSSAICRCCSRWSISGTRRRRNASQRVVVPYAHALSRAARVSAAARAREQRQVGDARRRAGRRPTAPAVWGEPGTDSQHAFFQWLHQGTHTRPGRVRRAACAPRIRSPISRAMLVANALAQAQALFAGKPLADGARRARRHRHGAGRDRRAGAAPRLSRRPAVDDAAAAGAQRPSPRPASRALRAPDVRRRRALRHQLRSTSGASSSARRSPAPLASRRCATARTRVRADAVDARACSRTRARSSRASR